MHTPIVLGSFIEGLNAQILTEIPRSAVSDLD